jgi:multicomponent Na+:H+ antiporter subunit G
MIVVQAASVVLISVGSVFYVAGTVALIRFPDVYARLHGLSKADNLGLGFVSVGLMIRSGWMVAAKIAFVWVFVLMASAVSAHLLARAAYRGGIPVTTAGARSGRSAVSDEPGFVR